MNPYLKAQREKYDALRTSIEGLQTRAADENRDLTDDELRSIREQGETAKGLASQITDLTEIENRSAEVASLRAAVTPADEEKRTSSTTTRDRDPGHYTRSSKTSFFNDMVRAKEYGDDDASRRLVEHNRALSTGTHGTGIVPPKWLTDEFAGLARQGRRVADAVRNIPLGDDPRPLTLPKQTAGTDAALITQTNENDTTTPYSDYFNTGVDTVTPKATTGGQEVSRQMLDMASPAIDQLIFGDLVAAYNQRVERLVVATMTASAGTAVSTYATEAAFNTGMAVTSAKIPVVQDVLTAAMAVRNARKAPADLLVMSVLRYGSFLGITDTTGRPLMPLAQNGPVNVFGVGSVQVDGQLHGLGVLASDGVVQYPENILAARASDTLLFESDMLRFQYEQPKGPETIRMGIWAYTACITRYAGQSVKRIQITAA